MGSVGQIQALEEAAAETEETEGTAECEHERRLPEDAAQGLRVQDSGIHAEDGESVEVGGKEVGGKDSPKLVAPAFEGAPGSGIPAEEEEESPGMAASGDVGVRAAGVSAEEAAEAADGSEEQSSPPRQHQESKLAEEEGLPSKHQCSAQNCLPHPIPVQESG